MQENKMPKLNEEQIIKSVDAIKKYSPTNLPTILLFALWCAFCIFLMVLVAIKAPIYAVLVPLAFLVIGAAILWKDLKKEKGVGFRDIVARCKKGEFEEGYRLAQTRSNPFALLVAILLAYHLFDDEEFLAESCPYVNESALRLASARTPEFEKIVRAYTREEK